MECAARKGHAARARRLDHPDPVAGGDRRPLLDQGILVRHRLTRRVAYGTVVRLTGMSATAAVLALTTTLHGSSIGAAALAAGVVVEAAASRWMARHLVASILAGPELTGASPITQRAIARFYYPLALTSIISLVTGPLLTFFMGRSRSPIESLAVMPVVQSLVFLFRRRAWRTRRLASRCPGGIRNTNANWAGCRCSWPSGRRWRSP